MATETLEVTAVSSPDNWILDTGADKVVAVNSPDDDGTSQIDSDGNVAEQWYTVADPVVIQASDTINSVTIHSRVATSGAGNGDWCVAVDDGVGVAEGLTRPAPALYTSYTDVFMVAPGFSSPWMLALLQALRIGIKSLEGRNVACTSLYVVVDYTTAAGTGSETLLPVSDDSGITGNVSTGWDGNYHDADEGVDAHDSASTYLLTQSNTTALLGMSNTTLTGTFTTIRLRTAALTNPGTVLSYQPYVNGVAVGSTRTLTTGGFWQTDEQTWAGSWSQADINTLQFALTRSSGSGFVFVSAVEAVVSKEAAVASENFDFSLDEPAYWGRPRYIHV
jgi:hypothetical protein